MAPHHPHTSDLATLATVTRQLRRGRLTPGQHYRQCRDALILHLCRSGLSDRLIAYGFDLSPSAVRLIRQRADRQKLRDSK